MWARAGVIKDADRDTRKLLSVPAREKIGRRPNQKMERQNGTKRKDQERSSQIVNQHTKGEIQKEMNQLKIICSTGYSVRSNESKAAKESNQQISVCARSTVNYLPIMATHGCLLFLMSGTHANDLLVDSIDEHPPLPLFDKSTMTYMCEGEALSRRERSTSFPS